MKCEVKVYEKEIIINGNCIVFGSSNCIYQYIECVCCWIEQFTEVEDKITCIKYVAINYVYKHEY